MEVETNFCLIKEDELYLIKNGNWKKYSFEQQEFVETKLSIQNLIFSKVVLNSNYGWYYNKNQILIYKNSKRLYTLTKNQNQFELSYLDENEEKFSNCFSFESKKQIGISKRKK